MSGESSTSGKVSARDASRASARASLRARSTSGSRKLPAMRAPRAWTTSLLRPADRLTANLVRKGSGIGTILSSGVARGPRQVLLAPTAHGEDDGHRAFAVLGQGVEDPRRHLLEVLTVDEPVGLELPQLFGQHLFGNALHQAPQLAEAQRRPRSGARG